MCEKEQVLALQKLEGGENGPERGTTVTTVTVTTALSTVSNHC